METAESARNLYVDPFRQAPHAFVLKEGTRAHERELCEFARANLAHFILPVAVLTKVTLCGALFKNIFCERTALRSLRSKSILSSPGLSPIVNQLSS